jgi:dTMP kinase
MSDTKHLPSGLIVMFEGVDGVGKSTQIQLAKAALEAEGWTVHLSRNLGGTPIGEALGKVMVSPLQRPPMTDMYVSAGIQEALIAAVAADRKTGTIILMDRSPMSLAAYAAYGGNADKDQAWQFVERGMSAMKPELVLVYEDDLSAALKRARQTSGKSDYYEDKPLSYFENVASGFREGAERYNATVIDASAGIEAVHDQTMQLIRQAIHQA